MRGADVRSGALFSYVDLEARVAKGHPLRAIRAIVNATLAELSPVFAKLYAPLGRPSIPPNNCSARCCCRRSTASARSGS